MPTVFFGHGSPMIALDHNELTGGVADLGRTVLDKFGRPQAILMVSAHWYTRGTWVQSTSRPRQIYDMGGFPPALYEVKYEPDGFPALAPRVIELLGNRANVDDSWGIDHGTWTVLVHAFPKADIPVVQLSVNAEISPQASFEIGRQLAGLREEGILIAGSGNVVHNLPLVEWHNPQGSPVTEEFNAMLIEKVKAHDYEPLVDYPNLPNVKTAFPTPDHYLPLLYVLGAAGEDAPTVFNNKCELGSMSMTSFAFGL